MPRSKFTSYADVPSRAVALFVDLVALTVLVFAAAIAVSVLAGPAVQLHPGADAAGEALTIDRGIATLDAAIALMLSAAYFTTGWVWKGASPGQRLVGLRVCEQHGGRPLGAGRALARWTALGAPFGAAALLTAALAPPGAWVFDLVLTGWYLALAVSTLRSPTRQGLHDRFAGSVVTRWVVPVAWSDAG